LHCARHVKTIVALALALGATLALPRSAAATTPERVTTVLKVTRLDEFNVEIVAIPEGQSQSVTFNVADSRDHSNGSYGMTSCEQVATIMMLRPGRFVMSGMASSGLCALEARAQ
jgi:hypothetical protein